MTNITYISFWKQKKVIVTSITIGGIFTTYLFFKYITKPPANTPKITAIQEIIKNKIWTLEYLVTPPGVSFYAKTTIIRLKNGNFFINSPPPINHILTNFLKQEQFKQNKIDFILFPSVFHDNNIVPWYNSIKNNDNKNNTKILTIPTLNEKYKEKVKFDIILQDTIIDDVELNEFDFVLSKGFKNNAEEVVVYHKETESLMLTDLVTYLGDKSKGINILFRWFLKLLDIWNKILPSQQYMTTIENNELIKEFINDILENKQWKYKRIIISHGDIFVGEYQQCKKYLMDAWDQFLNPPK